MLTYGEAETNNDDVEETPTKKKKTTPRKSKSATPANEEVQVKAEPNEAGELMDDLLNGT